MRLLEAIIMKTQDNVSFGLRDLASKRFSILLSSSHRYKSCMRSDFGLDMLSLSMAIPRTLNICS